MNNSWNEQLKNTEESDPAYQSILKTMEENRNKAQAIVNNPALWVSGVEEPTGAEEPNSDDRQHPTRKLVKAVQDEIASGANPSLIQRQIDGIPDPEARAAAQLALDSHTKKLPVLGPSREY
jgi:hypothetical protein